MVVQKSFGQILLPNDPGAALQAATKQYADAKVASVTALDSTVSVAGTTTVTVGVNAIPESKVTNLVSDLALKAPLASPTFTGTVTLAKMVQTPVALTFVSAGTTLVDASLGNTLRLTFGAGNTTMGAPSNPTDGQMILFEIKQDATGSRTITWTATAGGYAFGTLVTSPVLTTTASKTDYAGFIYNSTANIWRCLAFAPGY